MPTNNRNDGLNFSFAEMEREIRNMSKIATPFLEEYAQHTTIDPWIRRLKNFQASPPGATLDWAIPKEHPLKSGLSTGAYEPDGNGEHTVFATLSSIWQIGVPAAGGQMPKKGQLKTHFAVVGKASTRISIFSYRSQGDHTELARWRFEIGDDKSPGCHFHAQVMGEDGDVVFPKSMSVPRLPNLLFTPMDALEFALAELFQNEWTQHVSKETDAIRAWAGCQKQRLIKLLKWQQDRLARNTGSPWTSLKAEKPDPKLLLGAI